MMIGSVYLSSNLFVKSGTTVDAEYIAWRGMLADLAVLITHFAATNWRQVNSAKLFIRGSSTQTHRIDHLVGCAKVRQIHCVGQSVNADVVRDARQKSQLQ
jgi:hypothetical protein